MTSCAQGQIRNEPEASTFLLITLFCDGTRTQYKRAATKEGDCSCVSASRALLRGQTSSSEACPVTGPRWKVRLFPADLTAAAENVTGVTEVN